MIPPRDYVPETERRIIRYVLGQLTGPELDEVEERLLADEAFFEQVEAVEAEVCDDYVAGRLSAADRSAFDARLAGNRDLQRRVAFARALAASAPQTTRMATWWWAAAAALVLAAASGLWFSRDRTAPAPAIASGPAPGAVTPPQITSIPAPAAGQPRVTPAPPAVLATITLFGPVVRDAADMRVLSIPAGQGLVRVEVALQDGDVFPAVPGGDHESIRCVGVCRRSTAALLVRLGSNRRDRSRRRPPSQWHVPDKRVRRSWRRRQPPGHVSLSRDALAAAPP